MKALCSHHLGEVAEQPIATDAALVAIDLAAEVSETNSDGIEPHHADVASTVNHLLWLALMAHHHMNAIVLAVLPDIVKVLLVPIRPWSVDSPRTVVADGVLRSCHD